jgi:hypothetical protein
MSAAVIVFPGSNCDRDCKVAVERSTGAKVEMVWHQEAELPAGLAPPSEGWLRTHPGMLADQGGLDGFFVARWVKP